MSRPLPVITGTVVVDLRPIAYDRHRHALCRGLGQLEPGDHVRIIVGDDYPGYDAPEMLAELIDPHGTRVEVEGESDSVVREWTQQLRAAVAQRALAS